MDWAKGIISTSTVLDREQQDQYTIPIYVTDYGLPAQTRSPSKRHTNEPTTEISQFDVATLVITITDVNDHAPEFKPGSCYPLSIPENGETSVIHTMVATDLDIGVNAEISYSITGKYSSNQERGRVRSSWLQSGRVDVNFTVVGILGF